MLGVCVCSTACIATLDSELNQLSFCNVGDNGIIILRHIDSDIAGYDMLVEHQERTLSCPGLCSLSDDH